TCSGAQAVQRPPPADDFKAGRAAQIGAPVAGIKTIPPAACFFDDWRWIDPNDHTKGKEGIGHFVAENWVMYYPLRLVGIHEEDMVKADLVGLRWLFCGLFPFLSLIVFSWLTPRTAPDRADRFYVKLKTPVGATPDDDRK